MDEMETVITMDTIKDMEGVDIGAIMVIDTRRRITTEAEKRPIIETVELRPVRANRSRTTAVDTQVLSAKTLFNLHKDNLEAEVIINSNNINTVNINRAELSYGNAAHVHS